MIRCCTTRRHRGLVARALAALAENPANHPLGLAAVNALRGPDPLHAAAVTGNLWRPGRTLRVAFRGGRRADRAEVLAAFAEWSRYARLDFAETTGPAEIRCVFADASGDQGSWSYIGTDALPLPPADPTMNIGWPDDFARSLHEVGHVLGLVHEDQLPDANIPWDREAVYRYFTGPPNGWSRAEVDEQVLNPDTEQLTSLGFDAHSIMAYAVPAELLTDPSRAIPWNQSLSDEDKALAARLYPGRWTPPRVVTVQPNPPAPTPPPAPPTPPVTPLPKGPPVTPAPVPPAVQTLVSEAKTFLDGLAAHIDVAALEHLALTAAVSGNLASLWPTIQAQLPAIVRDPAEAKVVEDALRDIVDPSPVNILDTVRDALSTEVAHRVGRGLVGFVGALLRGSK